MRLLVLGIGNILMTDDGLGVHAANKLMQEDFPENVTIMESGTFTNDIFYLFENYTHVLVLDIVHAHANAGTIYRLTEKELTQNPAQRMSIHDVDLIDSINMAEMLYKKRPELFILGMEPEDYLSWSMELSTTVQEKFPLFLEKAREEIHHILKINKENNI